MYAPIAKSQTLKILFSYFCQISSKINQLDIEIVFLYGKINSEVYMYINQKVTKMDQIKHTNCQKRYMDREKVLDTGMNVSMNALLI